MMADFFLALGCAFVVTTFIFSITWIVVNHPWVGLPLMFALGLLSVLVGLILKRRKGQSYGR